MPVLWIERFSQWRSSSRRWKMTALHWYSAIWIEKNFARISTIAKWINAFLGIEQVLLNAYNERRQMLTKTKVKGPTPKQVHYHFDDKNLVEQILDPLWEALKRKGKGRGEVSRRKVNRKNYCCVVCTHFRRLNEKRLLTTRIRRSD